MATFGRNTFYIDGSDVKINAERSFGVNFGVPRLIRLILPVFPNSSTGSLAQPPLEKVSRKPLKSPPRTNDNTIADSTRTVASRPPENSERFSSKKTFHFFSASFVLFRIIKESRRRRNGALSVFRFAPRLRAN